VSIELLDGQHMGVDTKEFGKNAPPSLRMARVLGMYSSEPSSTSWSSVTIKMILGFLPFAVDVVDGPDFLEPE
jgi:hypothetical protein